MFVPSQPDLLAERPWHTVDHKPFGSRVVCTTVRNLIAAETTSPYPLLLHEARTEVVASACRLNSRSQFVDLYRFVLSVKQFRYLDVVEYVLYNPNRRDLSRSCGALYHRQSFQNKTPSLNIKNDF
jgi:hypothetical protein